MSWLTEIWRKPSEEWSFLPIPAGQAAEPIEEEKLAVDEVYIRLRLHSMRIPLSREGFSKFFGVVHAFTRVNDRKNGVSEFHVVTSPSKLEAIDRSHVDRVVMGKKVLLGPVVYRGGLEVDVGLFSVVAANLAVPYLTLLQTLSDTAGVAFVGAAAPIVATIKSGMELLAKQPGQAALEIGYSGQIDVPRAGYYLLARAPKTALDPANLRIDVDGRLAAEPVAQTGPVPYMVLSIESSSRRDDWFQIPEIREAYENVRAALAKRPPAADAKEQFDAFKVACLLSEDLVDVDARRLIDKVQALAQGMLGDGRKRTFRGAAPPAAPAGLPPMQEMSLYD